ncbi:MAG: alpha/beta hydrolase [Deltaproteobacteria bacterium]|nr:alpha/beta hydrolase [Deltaproteobacteria bacterium]
MGWMAPFVKRRLDLVTKIQDVRIPVIFFHGERDDMIPISMGRAVFDNASDPKAFYAVERAGHNDLIQVSREWYWEVLKDFLDSVAPL